MIVNTNWDKVLESEFEKPYFADLMQTVENEYAHYTVYPPRENIFAALRYVDYDKVKVVILGQDPYHGYGQANGLAFAVNKGSDMPPSLVNIFTEVESDIGIRPNDDTSLIGWADQGVLLLNSALTVRAGCPQSHSRIGWYNLTDAMISALNDRDVPVAYILWGMSARQKSALIDKRNFVTMSAHPSPLSANRGFFGSRPFSKVNAWLVRNGMSPVFWQFTDNFTPASYYEGGGSITRC